MIKEFYIDYSKMIKLRFQITDNELRYDLICESDDERLSSVIISNLKSISTIEDISEKDIYRYKINEQIFVDISKKDGSIKFTNKLTTFEIRSLAQGKNEDVPLARNDDIDYHPKTDLHTHFAGAITSDSLIKIGLEHNLKYPAWCLEKMGIDIDKYGLTKDDKIDFNRISNQDLETMKFKLKISPITQETFNKMEEIYALRGPFTKNKELFPVLLRELAYNYADMGIEYVELSFSSFLEDKDYLKLIEKYVPIIENETGVKIRFLAGLWRHSDKEWNLDLIDNMKTIAKSRYVVGCDYMGHETNPTYVFEEELQNLARYAMMNDPNFVIRVHAGENPMFKSNVYDVLKIIYDEHQKLQNETGLILSMPRVRIGHGLYGLDITSDGKWNSLEENAVLNLAKEMGAIVEFNMSSNLALNNINSIEEVPIKKYVDAGIKVVLGTDGHGMYSTSSLQESVLAEAAGLNNDDFLEMDNTESEVIQKAIEREKAHPLIEDIDALYNEISYSTLDGKPRWNEIVAQKKRDEQEKLINFLNNQLAESGAITDKDLIERDTNGKTPIMITGASATNWPNISIQDQELIKLEMQVLADTLNPKTTYIVTGGTNFGVEKEMHEAVQRRNSSGLEPIACLGTVTMEAAQKGDAEIQPGTITHAEILELDGHKVKTWMDLPDTQLEYVRERGGEMIAVGGGSVVNDMIQRGYNLGVNMHLMDGPYGASTNKSKSMKGNNYSFKSIEELLTRLYNKNPNYFEKSFSLDKIDEYINAAAQLIDYNESLDNDFRHVL